MNSKHPFIFTLALVLLTALLTTPALADSHSDEAIADWVAVQMKITQPFDMPVRHYVDKKNLGQTWQQANKEAYYRWEEAYGRDKAKAIVEDYMDQIVGLFHEKTQIIYVGNFMEPCSQEAIFAHEMAHYFQHLTDGVIPRGSYGEDLQRAMREMQAYNVESLYRSEFCTQITDAEDSKATGNTIEAGNEVKTQS